MTSQAVRLVSVVHYVALGLLLLSPFPLRRIAALTAFPMTPPAACVLLGELVALCAVGPSGIDSGRADPSQHVLTVRYCLKVIRVNASPIAAQVIEFKSIRYRSHVLFIGQSVGRNLSPPHPTNAAANPHPAVAILFVRSLMGDAWNH